MYFVNSGTISWTTLLTSADNLLCLSQTDLLNAYKGRSKQEGRKILGRKQAAPCMSIYFSPRRIMAAEVRCNSYITPVFGAHEHSLDPSTDPEAWEQGKSKIGPCRAVLLSPLLMLRVNAGWSQKSDPGLRPDCVREIELCLFTIHGRFW